MVQTSHLAEEILSPLLYGGSACPKVHGHPFVKGYIFNLRTVPEGLLIMIKDLAGQHSIPSNAVGTLYGWLLIPAENKHQILMAAGCWIKKIPIIAYCAGLAQNFGVINRITPLAKPGN